jgi:hypothetical protein
VQTLLQRTLHSGGPVPVIPIFIGGAEMPKRATCPDPLKSLPDRNGLPARPEPDFEDSVRSLIEHVGKILAFTPQPPAATGHAATEPPPRVSPTRLDSRSRSDPAGKSLQRKLFVFGRESTEFHFGQVLKR